MCFLEPCWGLLNKAAWAISLTHTHTHTHTHTPRPALTRGTVTLETQALQLIKCLGEELNLVHSTGPVCVWVYEVFYVYSIFLGVGALKTDRLSTWFVFGWFHSGKERPLWAYRWTYCSKWTMRSFINWSFKNCLFRQAVNCRFFFYLRTQAWFVLLSKWKKQNTWNLMFTTLIQTTSVCGLKSH